MDKKKNIVKQFFDIGLGTLFGAILGFFTTPFVTRVINPEEYGKLAIVNSHVGIILSISYFGLDKGLIRFFYTRNNLEDERSLLKLCIYTSMGTATFILAFLWLLQLSGLVNFEFTNEVYFLTAIYTLVSVWNTYSNNMLRLTYKTREYSFSLVVQKIIYILIIYTGTALHRNDLALLLVSTIGSISVGTFVSMLYTKEYWNFNKTDFCADRKDIFKYSTPYIIYALFITLIDSMDKFFIERYCDDAEVGIFSSAFTLIVIFTIVQSVFNTIWSPIQTEHFIEKPDDPTTIRKGNRYITIIMFMLGFGVILTKDILVLLLGQSYRYAVSYMPFLVIDSLMMILAETVNCGINISKKSYLFVVITGAACVVDFGLLYLLVPTIGAKGASIARCIANMTYFYLTMHFSNKYYYIDYAKPKLFIASCLIMIYACFNTFFVNTVFNITFFIVSISVILVMYKEDIKELKILLKDSFVKRKLQE